MDLGENIAQDGALAAMFSTTDFEFQHISDSNLPTISYLQRPQDHFISLTENLSDVYHNSLIHVAPPRSQPANFTLGSGTLNGTQPMSAILTNPPEFNHPHGTQTSKRQ